MGISLFPFILLLVRWSEYHVENLFLSVCSAIGVMVSVVPTGSPSRGRDVVVYVFDTNQPSLPTPSYSVLACVSVFVALSRVFHSINSPNNSLLSHSVLLV